MFCHIRNACKNSLAGLQATIKEEFAFRLILIQTLVIATFSFFLPLSYLEQSLLLINAGICIIVELLNSAIENVVDLVTTDWHILAKRAKDMASAAQFAAMILLYLQIALLIRQHL